MKYLPNFVSVFPGLVFCLISSIFILFLTILIDLSALDPLILALVFGILYRNIFSQLQWHITGAKFAGKYVLEFSVFLLGASIYLPSILSNGGILFLLIIFCIIGSIGIAYLVGHVMLGLNKRIATLVGVGNSICGNSAIAAVAPVIGATSIDISSVIGISAILGAAQILLLPFIFVIFDLNNYQYGIVAGLSVYAVAQVYAASAIISETSASMATLVKLIRVVLLGPLVVAIAVIQTVSRTTSFSKTLRDKKFSIRILSYLPWFVLGFIVLSMLRSLSILSEEFGNHIRQVAEYFFVVSMVGIGLDVNIRDVLKVGPRIALTILAVLAFMVSASLIGVKYLNI
ncbi:MAG: hypothetical protein CL785_02160 [Chloroflexi bacterium]|nr:hypothetical protein [Chloroflexota bacterium]